MKMLRNLILVAIFVVGCNTAPIGNELLTENTYNDCFDEAILLQNASDQGRISGLTFGKGICYEGSVALDANSSFTFDAIVVNDKINNQMYASYLFAELGKIYVKDESSQKIEIGQISTKIGEVELVLNSNFQKRIMWEDDDTGAKSRVLVLERTGQ